jgi:hypothetical protein
MPTNRQSLPSSSTVMFVPPPSLLIPTIVQPAGYWIHPVQGGGNYYGSAQGSVMNDFPRFHFASSCISDCPLAVWNMAWMVDMLGYIVTPAPLSRESSAERERGEKAVNSALLLFNNGGKRNRCSGKLFPS